jgi:AcrR family transcriptional regulator
LAPSVQKAPNDAPSGKWLLPTAAPGPLGLRRTSPSRSRKSDASARNVLIEAAIRLFCRHGINATGIEAVVAEAGVARMTIYNQFGSKDGLVVAALTHEGATWRAWFFASLAAVAGGPKERLLGIFDVLEEWFSRDDFFGCALMNAVVEYRGEYAEVRQVVLAHKSQVLGQVRALATAAGVADSDAVTEQIDLLIDGAIVKSAIKKDPRAAREGKAILSALLAADPGLNAK